MTAAYIAAALHGRKCGSRWIACCPAHKEKTPSFSICELDGRILVHCFAGCTQDAVIKALRDRGLWPEPSRTTSERRHSAKAYSRARAEGVLALAWRSGMIAKLQKAKGTAYARFSASPTERSERAWAEASRQLFWYESLDGSELASKYRRACRLKPQLVKRLIAEARKDVAHAERTTKFIVAILSLAAGGAE